MLATLEPRNLEREQKVEAGRRKVMLVKDSSAQTTPPNSPLQRNNPGHRSQHDVTAGSKVNGLPTTEFRTVVNVFDERFRQDNSSEMMVDRPRGVVLDSDSFQSTAADNGRRVYSDKLRRSNGPLQPGPAQNTSPKGLGAPRRRHRH